jgi:apolipoprotein N-acyltransferase
MKQQLSPAVNPVSANQPLPVSSTFYFLILLVGIVSNILASAKWGIAGFAWIAPLCSLFFYRFAPMKRKFLWLFIGFSISSIVGSYDVAPFPIVVLIVLGIIEALKISLIYIVDKFVRRKSRLFVSTLFFPAAFVTLEFINTKIGGGIWWSVANSQFPFHWLIQLASVTGMWGISFLIYWFASVAIWILESFYSHRSYKTGLIIYSSSLIAILLFGFVRFNVMQGDKIKTVRVSGVSVPMFGFLGSVYKDFCGKEVTINPRSSVGSKELRSITSAQVPFIETADTMKFRNGYASMRSLNDSLFELSQRAAEDGAKIVVWSEANALIFEFDDSALISRASAFAAKNKIYLLASVAVIHPGKITPGKKFLENKATLFGPDGRILNVFHKNNPVPMAEASVPGDGIIPVIETPYGKISTSICYDADFPAQMRQLGKNKSDLLLLPSGDWYAIAPYHTYMAAFRGIENGTTIMRQASGGLSAVTDYRGKLIHSFDFYQTGTKIWSSEIPVGHVPTVYNVIGDAFAYLCIKFSIFVLVWLLVSAVSARFSRKSEKMSIA